MINKTVREFYILTALNCFGHAVTCAMYVSFLTHHGLNLLQVNIVNFVFFATLFLAEIPTGAFADVFGRKKSYIMSCGLFAIGTFTYGMSDSFIEFAISEAICAIGATFASGAFRAWFVDRLRHHGYTDRLTPIFARASRTKHVTSIVAVILGAYLADVSMVIPWFVGSAALLFCGVIASFIDEEYFVRKKFSIREGARAMEQTVVASIQYGINNKSVRFVLVIVVAQIFAVQGPNMQWQPFFKQWLPNQSSMGYIYAGIMVSMMIGAWIAPIILRRCVSERRALLVLEICIGAFVVFAAMSGTLGITLVMFLLHEVARGSIEPIKDAYLHDNIPSKERATIESFESLAHHAGGAIGLLVTGAFAKHFGITPTWIMCGTVLIVAMLFVARNGNGK